MANSATGLARRPSHILVADDSELTRALLRRKLGRCGHIVLEAQDGCATIEAAEHWPLDLVLLDLRLPDIDGLEVLRQLRRTFDGIRLPVIMITAENDAEIISQCLCAGANGYVTKPFAWAVLRESLEVQLRRRSDSGALWADGAVDDPDDEDMSAD